MSRLHWGSRSPSAWRALLPHFFGRPVEPNEPLQTAIAEIHTEHASSPPHWRP